MKKALLSLLLFTLPPAAAGVEDLGWMSGQWSATIRGVVMDEVWSAPGGKLLVGMHRDVGPKRTTFEFMRIEETADGVVFFAQPSGRPAVPFRLTESAGTRAVFSNPEHDFPQRLIYWRDGERLCARVEGPPTDTEAVEEWCWERKK